MNARADSVSGWGETLPRPVVEAIRVLAVAGLYWLTAEIGLHLALVRGQVTPIWPPTGLAVAALLVFGPRVWPAITLAAFVVNLPIGPSPISTAGIAAGNTLAPLAASALLRRVDFHRELDRPRDALAIVGLGALAPMVISASCGSLVLLTSGAISPDHFWGTWTVWWTGDAMGVLLVTPFIFSLYGLPPWRRRWEYWAGLTAALVATGLVASLCFQSDLRLEYLVFPVVAIAAWRFRQQGAAPAALVASGAAVWAAVHGTGSFASEDLVGRMVTLQVFNASIAFASFVLASFVISHERKEELRRLLTASELANEAKSRFLNMAAHELRTPLSVLLGYLSILSDGTLGRPPAAWSPPLAILDRKGRELNRIVDDLLAAARIEAEALPSRPAAVDLREVIGEAVKRATPRVQLLEGSLSVNLVSRPVMARIDSDQIGRILDNLINNALSYADESPHVVVHLREQGRTRILVKDNGIGIAADLHEKIFERFFRADASDHGPAPGTGLGLHISRHLAEANGGSLVVDSSTPGRGTTFALELPAYAPTAAGSESGLPPTSPTLRFPSPSPDGVNGYR